MLRVIVEVSALGISQPIQRHQKTPSIAYFYVLLNNRLMSYFLRFHLCADAFCQASTPFPEDIALDELPQFDYGQCVRIGDDQDEPSAWSEYRVARIPCLEQIPHPTQPDTPAVLVEVYVVRSEHWPLRHEPDQVWLEVIRATG